MWKDILKNERISDNSTVNELLEQAKSQPNELNIEEYAKHDEGDWIEAIEILMNIKDYSLDELEVVMMYLDSCYELQGKAQYFYDTINGTVKSLENDWSSLSSLLPLFWDNWSPVIGELYGTKTFQAYEKLGE